MILFVGVVFWFLLFMFWVLLYLLWGFLGFWFVDWLGFFCCCLLVLRWFFLLFCGFVFGVGWSVVVVCFLWCLWFFCVVCFFFFGWVVCGCVCFYWGVVTCFDIGLVVLFGVVIGGFRGGWLV